MPLCKIREVECGIGADGLKSRHLPPPLRVRGEHFPAGVSLEPDSSRSAQVTRLGCWVPPRLMCIKRVQVANTTLVELVHFYCNAPKIGVSGLKTPLFAWLKNCISSKT